MLYTFGLTKWAVSPICILGHGGLQLVDYRRIPDPAVNVTIASLTLPGITGKTRYVHGGQRLACQASLLAWATVFMQFIAPTRCVSACANRRLYTGSNQPRFKTLGSPC